MTNISRNKCTCCISHLIHFKDNDTWAHMSTIQTNSHIQCTTVKNFKKKGWFAQTFAVESERAGRGGRHDLAVYPQCLPQNFDAIARSQAEKFPKTCSACRKVLHANCEPGPWGSVCPLLIDRKSVCRAPQTLQQGREHAQPHLWYFCVSHRWFSSSACWDQLPHRLKTLIWQQRLLHLPLNNTEHPLLKTESYIKYLPSN